MGKTGVVTPAITLLDEAGVDYRLREYERGDDLRDFGREAADALGLPYEQVFKTLVAVADDELVVAVVPVSGMVNLKRLAAAVGAKKATMCDPTTAERTTGYVLGGISPLGQKRRLPTVVDETAELFATILVSGGKRGLDIELAPGDLIRLLDATTADVADV